MTVRELNELLDFTCDLSRAAGAVLRRGFNKVRDVRYKGRIDPVTEYDLKAEKLITSRILRRYPHHEILAEEGSAIGERSDYRWVIDPLDGTVNYSHGFPVYCVSIGLEYRGKIIAGVVFDPEREELFSTCGYKPSRLNGRPISVTRERNLERSLLATGFAYDIGSAKRNNLGLFARMAKQAQGIRRAGSAALDLCWVACGRFDGFWELKLHPWDTAAAALIVRNAGGKTTRLDGGRYSIFDPDLLASNGHIHHSMTATLSSTR